MAEYIETVIIGAGQSGLATSYQLSQHHREHLVLERAARAGHVWRDERWDSFALFSPNWTFRMPGAEYRGDQPDAFMPRDEMAALLEGYPERFHLPVCYNAPVTGIERVETDGTFVVCTPERDWRARNLVVAIGRYQEPSIPAVATELPDDVYQLPSRDYRNPESLPPGAVLVVGSAQTGCQIVEDLQLAGRKVYLSVSSAGRLLRRYRGKDIFDWLVPAGFFERTVDMLPSPRMRFVPHPHLTGARGGHSVSLRQFARDGIVLLGHFQSVQDGVASFAPDLIKNILNADEQCQKLLKVVDDYIDQHGLEAPRAEVAELHDNYLPPILDKLNLREAGISTIIWASGFRFDYRWIQPAVLDEFGYPTTNGSPANAPGLYFVGLPWLPRGSAGLLLGVGQVAEAVAEDIVVRATHDVRHSAS
jgi:putative flavoprotein involved in K+ transport